MIIFDPNDGVFSRKDIQGLTELMHPQKTFLAAQSPNGRMFAAISEKEGKKGNTAVYEVLLKEKTVKLLGNIPRWFSRGAMCSSGT
mmetsp:Transcript_7600/g.5744  ORF Transcript_7600/g.5744 Transcript_7600/m.5744 type:complete len:86 (+) Transcript_7600:198-455(+)